MIKSIFAAILAAFAAVAISPAAADEPSTLALVGPATTPIASMAPNGRFLAVFKRDLNPEEERKLLFIDLDGAEAPIVAPLGKNTDVLGMAWVNDDRVVLIGSQERKVRSGPFWVELDVVRILSIDRRAKDVVVLFEDADSVETIFSPPAILNMLPDDPDHIIMSAFGPGRDTLDIWKVNVNNAKTQSLARGDSSTFAWYLDSEGAPVFRTAVNNRQTYIRTYASADKGESWEQVHEQVIRDLTNEPARFQPVGPISQGKYTVVAQAPGANRMAVHEYDVVNKKFGKPLYEHPDVDVTQTLTDPATGKYLGARYAVDKFEYEIADPDLKSVVDGLELALGDTVSIAISDMSRDRQRFLIRVTGPQAPGDYYFFDRKTMALNFLFSSRDALDPAQLSPVEIMKVPMSDGMEITSYVTHPNGDRTGVYPLLVVPHGGPQSRDFYTYDLFGQFFASRGYRVIQTNFRGSAGYGEDFVEAGHREWGKRMQDDVMESAEALVDRGIARPKNMCIFGWSYGGYVAMSASFLNGDLFSASISTAGVSDLLESLKTERLNGGRNGNAYKYWSTAIGDEAEDRDDLIAHSAARNADKVAMPVLLFHGEDDSIVEPEQSRIFESALKRAGKSVEYYEYKDTAHGIVTFNNNDLEQMFNRVDSFCKEHLPAQ